MDVRGASLYFLSIANRFDRKTFITVHTPEPIFDLLGQFVAMALEDEVFTAKFKCLEDIYWQPIPSHQCGMAVKIKADKLDIPVFREPEQTTNSLHASMTKPLKGSTWNHNLKHIGIISGLKCLFSQYVLRWSLINLINSMS